MLIVCDLLCDYFLQEKYSENQELFTNVIGFKEAIISCKENFFILSQSYWFNVVPFVDIVDIINSSFQTISDDLLKSYLGETNGR